MEDWGKIVLCREDFLLRKIANEREDEDGCVPQYLLNYLKKLLIK